MKNGYLELFRTLLDHCPTMFNSMMDELFDITFIMCNHNPLVGLRKQKVISVSTNWQLCKAWDFIMVFQYLLQRVEKQLPLDRVYHAYL